VPGLGDTKASKKSESIPSIVSPGPLIPTVNVQREDELEEMELGTGDNGLNELSKGPPELGRGSPALL
jgi:hypothetical protein